MRKKINITYEELYELYITHNKTQEEIAIECGCGESKIYRLLKEYNIKKEKINITYERLYELYIVHNKTQGQVAIDCGCGNSKIYRLLKEYNIVKSQEQISETREQTCLKRLGVEYPAQSKDVQEKMKQTCKERLGVEHPLQSKDVLEKHKQTNLKKRGVEYSMQSKDVQEKSKQTNLKKRGVEYPLQSKEVQEKHKQTCKERLGVEYPAQSKDVQEKHKKTCKERLGVEHPMHNKDVQEKMRTTVLKKYNCKNVSQKHISPDKIEIYTNKDKLINWLNTIDYEERTSKYCSKKLGLKVNAFNVYIIKYDIFNLVNHTKSEWENEAKRWFDNSYPNLTVQYNTKSIIKPYELDIYIPEYNIGIELNGSYWHSNKAIQESRNMSSEEYHNLKEQLCKEKGITLYTIWDTDLNEDNTLEHCLEKIFKNI